jgi:hypothetical protein
LKGSVHTGIGPGVPHLAEEPLFWGTYLFVRFLQGFFNCMANGHYHWEPKGKPTEIHISDQATVEEEVVAQRPAVLTIRGPARFSGLTLDQLMAQDLLTGERVHSDLIPGTMTLQCISSEGAEAQHVAWLAGQGVMSNRRLLQKRWQLTDEDGETFFTFGFHKVSPQISFGSETAAGSIVQGTGKTEYILVPVQIPYFMQWTWKATPLAPEYKETLGLILSEARASDVEKPTFDPATNIRMGVDLVSRPITLPNGRRVVVSTDGFQESEI